MIVAAGLLVAPRLLGKWAAAVALAATAVGVAGTAAYAITTVETPHTGAIVTAGPAGAASRFGGPGGRFGFPGGGGFRGFNGFRPGTRPGNGIPALPGFGPNPAGGAVPANPFANGAPPGFGGLGGGRGGLGGLLDSRAPSAALTKLLEQHASRYRWVAATIGSNNAASLQLATDDPVMSIGGFNGTDPTPTLAQFERYVGEGKIHYFIGGGAFGFGGGGANGTGTQISSWVTQHFTAKTVGGETVYDLTTPNA